MASSAKSLPQSPEAGLRLLLPITIESLKITLRSPQKQLVCKLAIGGSEVFSYPGTAIPEDKVKACHGLLARYDSQLQVQLYSDRKVYAQCDVSLWDLLVSEQETTLPMLKHEFGKAKQKGDLAVQLKCSSDHLELYRQGSHPDYPVFDDLTEILDVLKDMGPINARGQKIARYCLAKLYEFLKTDLPRQRDSLRREKMTGDSASCGTSDSCGNALEDTVTQCRHQLVYLKTALAMYSNTSALSTELLSIGSEILDSIAEASCMLCYHAHMYVYASYNNLRRVSSGDHSIILRTHEKLLYLRARMVYLHHENATPPPEDKLIEDLLEHAISETRRGRDWNESSYTAVLSCFCGPYADRAFDTIIKKLQDLQPADASQRDVLRRLLTCFSRGGDWIPRSIVFKAGQVTLGESQKIREGSYGIVRMGRLMVEGERHAQPVEIKAIKFLSSGALEDRKEQRRRLYLEIVNCWTLKHPNVLRLLGVDFQHGETCLVSPLKKHGDIINVLAELQRGSNVLQYGRPLVELSHKWIGQVIRGITYLHEEGIVHGDLRGNNIYVNDDLSVVIAEFDLSVFANGNFKDDESRRGGNAEWLSPELLELHTHTRPTKASDIYSFAMVCIETYTGRSPFQGCKVNGEFLQNLRVGQRPTRPNEPSRHQEPKGAPMNDDLWSLVQRCWNVDTGLRPSAAEAEQLLKELKYLQ